MIAALLVVLGQTIFMFVVHGVGANNASMLLDLSRIIIIGICILVVSIPEGLPLAVSIAMALSVDRLKNNKILIKNLQAVQTCSMLHDVCIGKTGTLTSGDLTVSKYALGESMKAEKHDKGHPSVTKQGISTDMLDIMLQAIIGNSEARFEPDTETLTYQARGNPIDVAMLKFLWDNNTDVYETIIQREKLARKLLVIPFDNKRKTSFTVRIDPRDDTQVNVFMKGAPESLLAKCDSIMTSRSDLETADDQWKEDHLNQVVSEQMAKESLKTVAYAYRMIPKDTFNDLLEHDPESEYFLEELQRDLVYLGTFGLEDPLRPNVQDSVQMIRFGTIIDSAADPANGIKEQVKVRLVSGDHMEACKRTAIHAGLISHSQAEQPGVCMTGEQFEEAVGGYEKIWNDQKKAYYVQYHDQSRFEDVARAVRVISRATLVGYL